jgi:hypothetical protein
MKETNMAKQIFRLAQSDELVFYARSSGGKLLTQYIHDSGYNSFDQVADVLMSMIPKWYDEGLVCMQITCEAKGLTKNINKRISKR